MTIEERLRAAMQQAVAGVEPGPDGYARIHHAIREKRRRRNRAGVAAAAAAVAVAVAVAVLGVVPEPVDRLQTGPAGRPATTGAGEEAGPVSGTAPATTAGAGARGGAARPRVVVASRTDRVVVLDGETGALIRTLHTVPPAPSDCEAECEQHVGTVELSPDGSTVYFEEIGEPASGSIYRVPVGGGTLELIANGGYPVLSADGKHLAFSVPGYGLVVRSLESGQDRVFDGGDEYLHIANLALAPDGTRLVYERGPGEPSLWVLDLVSATSARDARRIQPRGMPATGIDSSLLAPAFRSSGSGGYELVAARHGQAFGHDGLQLVRIDLSSNGIIGTSPAGDGVRRLDYDASGRFRLTVSGDEGTVRSAGPDGVRELGRGFVDADW